MDIQQVVPQFIHFMSTAQSELLEEVFATRTEGGWTIPSFIQLLKDNAHERN
jgi:hypothetical protein